MASTVQSPTAESAASPSDIHPAPPSLASRPSLCMKLLPTAASPPDTAVSPAVGLTSKEWIVPPRPKPGRKPATDTPPTKRKAQNRAAQRAFRERRAARVGELEDQLRQIEEEYEQEQESLKSNISKLEGEIERYQSELATWIERYGEIEKELTDMRLNVNRIPKSSDRRPDTSDEVEILGCGNCTSDSRCQCIDDAVDAMTSDASRGRDSKLEHSHVKAEPSDNMEIDFTTAYSNSRSTINQHPVIPPSPAVADPCGFCQDGTPCICAEMATEQQQACTQIPSSPIINTHRPPRQLAQFTPPPSEGDVAHLASATAASGVAGPGTCTQCQTDPNSTLFCKSLAASRSQMTGEASGCCGGKGPDGSCCQSQPAVRLTRSRVPAPSRQLPPLQNSQSSITLSCADAYTTLSRHPAYEKASSEIATWMPKLYANPNGAEGRPAMEIDAANVMSVLRDFDRRFGSDR